MNSDDLTGNIFLRLTELRDILSADGVSRKWHEVMQDDRVWEPLCRRFAGKGLATGFGMLATVKTQPECQLSWRQLFVQRARALNTPAHEKEPRTIKREDYRLGVEIYLMGRRERVRGDARDDAAVLAALRDLLTREQPEWTRPGSNARRPRPEENKPDWQRTSRERDLAQALAAHPDPTKIAQWEALAHFLQDQHDLLQFAVPHVYELFGEPGLRRSEWVQQQAVEIVKELFPREPQIDMPALEDWKADGKADAAHFHEQMLLRRIEELRGSLVQPNIPDRPCGCAQCEEFWKEVPSGEPLMSSLVELPAANASDEYSLCRFTNPPQGREFDWGEGGKDQAALEACDEEGGRGSYLPEVEDISMGVFLLRKKDCKRLELTAGVSNPSQYEEREPGAVCFQDGDFDRVDRSESFIHWGLCMNAGSKAFQEPLDKVRFEAKIRWKDGKDIDEWYADRDNRRLDAVHDPHFLITSLDVSLLEEKTTHDWQDGAAQVRRESRPGPDELLEMLESPLVADRWV